MKLSNNNSKQNLYMGSSGAQIFNNIANKQLDVLAYAPDMVKWTKKDLKKLMADKKPPEEN